MCIVWQLASDNQTSITIFIQYFKKYKGILNLYKGM